MENQRHALTIPVIISIFLWILFVSPLANALDVSPSGTGVPGSPSLPSIPTQFGAPRGTDLLVPEDEQPQPDEKPAIEKLFAPQKDTTAYEIETSAFEKYLSKKLDVTPLQLSILKLQPDIKFYQTPVTPLPPGYLMFYIPHELGGGFVIGAENALSQGFKAAGIKSSLYISTEIRQFGYNFFEKSPSTFAPVGSVPVGPGYILGPGDELRIAIWGKVNAEYKSVINRDGNLHLPTAGVLHLAGMTFDEASVFIEKEFSRYYTDLKINISMGSLKSIQVFVVGNVQRPGSYTLSSFSTIVHAIFAAGGPSKVGTMRDIEIKRNNKTVVSLDLYDLILRGDKTNDIRLLSEDVIFVPHVGPLVGIAGNVKSPAIYELKEEMSILDFIEMAGGANSISFKNRVQIMRIEDGNKQILFELNLARIESDGNNNIALKDGDFLKIFPVSQIVEKVVHITGAVRSPGTYGYQSSMTIRDLLTFSGGLLRYANREEAELTRVDISPDGPKTERIVVRLHDALEGNPQYNISLKEDDYLFVRTVPEWEMYRTVAISGEVRFPGTYTIDKGETLSSLIDRAGGYTGEAYLKGAVFTRESVRHLQQRQLDESINRLEQEIISTSAQTIEAALTSEEASQQKAAVEQRRSLIAKMRAAKAKGNVSIKLSGLDKFKGSAYDIPLEEGDALNIPEKPHQVQVIGAVYNPTAFVYNPGLKVASYIKDAGGLTRNAEANDIYILKMDGTAISKREWSGPFSISWDADSNRWFKGGFLSATMDPGDTIVVPEKIERIVWLREIKDLTQILYQIAVTAGVLIVAF